MSIRSNPDPDERQRRRRRLMVALGTAVGVLIATDLSFAASNWTIGLAPGSSGEAASGSVSNLVITATASPAPGNLLYPGSQGDVVLTISNPNKYPVTITALQFPSSATGAAAYSSSDLNPANAVALCTSLTSGVTWTYSTVTGGASQTLATPLVVAPSGATNNPLTVTLTNYASMASSSPSACENSYFSMPSLAGVTATAGGATVTTSPTTDS